MLALLERAAVQAGVRTLTGEFIPSAKNQPAAAFLPEHGFVARDGGWRLDVETPRPLPDCFRLEDASGLSLI